jgi:hypothetical protein
MLRLVALALLLATPAALAQTGQFPGVASPTPSPFTPPPQLGGAPAPPAALPVPAVPRNTPRTLVTRPHGPAVEVPGGPGYFSNKVERCLDAAANAGLSPTARAAFTRRCAN